jgi:hypothetical protein
MMVILDNHMTDADWCCQRADCNGLWVNGRGGALLHLSAVPEPVLSLKSTEVN